jgi:16S rRNA processing protein RimM
MEQLLAVGRVARAHGVRGRVLIAPYNAASDGLTRVQQLWVGERRFEVDRVERVNLGYLVALRGIETREEADKLRGEQVRAARSELPPLEEGELYAVDLIGFQVVDAQGRARGVVEGVEEAGPQDLLRLRGGMLVPFALVKEVKDGSIVVEAPEGLFELEE